MAYTYAKLYKIPITGLRFLQYTVQQVDQIWLTLVLLKKLVNGEDIQIFNYGNCKRDFTYIDDIVEGIIKVLQKTPTKDEDNVQYKLYNIAIIILRIY